MSPVEGDLAQKNEAQSSIPYREDQIDPVVLSRFLGHLVQVEIKDRLASVANETLVLWGERDTFIPSEWGTKLDWLLPNSQYMEMPGEYHNIATVHPKTLAKVISEFVI